MAAQVGAAQPDSVIDMGQRCARRTRRVGASAASRVGRPPDADRHRRALDPRAPSSSTAARGSGRGVTTVFASPDFGSRRRGVA